MERFKPNIIKNIVFIISILLILFFLNYFIRYIENESLTSNENKLSIGSSFVLVDQANKLFSSSNHKKYKLIYFGYTFCPDVCPLDLIKLNKVFESNKKLKQKVTPIFISLDPERDKPEVINEFLKNYEMNIVGLTGEVDGINNILKKFRVYKKKRNSDQLEDNYLIDHTSLFYLLDQNDKYVTHFNRSDFTNQLLKFTSSYSFP